MSHDKTHKLSFNYQNTIIFLFYFFTNSNTSKDGILNSYQSKFFLICLFGQKMTTKTKQRKYPLILNSLLATCPTELLLYSNHLLCTHPHIRVVLPHDLHLVLWSVSHALYDIRSSAQSCMSLAHATSSYLFIQNLSWTVVWGHM